MQPPRKIISVVAAKRRLLTSRSLILIRSFIVKLRLSRCGCWLLRCHLTLLPAARETLYHVKGDRDEETGDECVGQHAHDHHRAQCSSPRAPGTRGDP